jgi:RNA polymerase sigma-70 factor, ECF subfamily
MEHAHRAAERVARAFYGRLVALLAARTRDIAAAEDALAEAFVAALRTWPERGVPDNPEAWLLTAARRSFEHGVRHAAVREAAAGALRLAQEEMEARVPASLPDERLKLLFVCAHPAIDGAARTPLMLQTVLGLDAARIGAAFLIAPATMSQRLVRAKAKIKEAGLRFAEPDPHALRDRLDAVLSAIYAAYGTAWDDAPGAEGDGGLAEEAIYLSRLLVELLPGEPEPRGLLSLILHCEARAAARRTADGAFVPLAEQDAGLWSRSLIVEAEALLTEASRFGRFGRFQTEAAIQSVHAQRAVTGRTEVRALVMLYDVLVRQAPSIGALVARAITYGNAFGPEAGLTELDTIATERVASYQPYWAARAHLLQMLGRSDAAGTYERAIGLTSDPAVRSYLSARRGSEPVPVQTLAGMRP